MAVEVASPAVQRTAELSVEELRAALGVGRIFPAGQSPLVLEGGDFIQPAETVPEAALESLYRKGLLAMSEQPALRAEWQQALETLADPLWDLSMIVGREGRLNYDRYFSSDALEGDSLVFHRPVGDGRFHVSFPHRAEYLLGLMDRTIRFEAQAPASEASVELNYKEYIVLMALVDVLRRHTLEGLLQRRTDEPGALAASDVVEAVRTSMAESDCRWLVSLGNTVSPFEFKLDQAEVQALLEALSLRGYLTPQENGFTATDALHEMARSLMLVPTFVAFELTFIKSADVFEINYFAAVRGLDSIWLFDFFELATQFPRVSLMTVSGEELGLMLERLFDESREKSEPLARARQQAAEARRKEGVGEVARPQSPPTLRLLKVPSTLGRLRGAEAAPVEMAPSPGLAAAAVQPPVAIPGVQVPPPPPQGSLAQTSPPPTPVVQPLAVETPPTPPQSEVAPPHPPDGRIGWAPAAGAFEHPIPVPPSPSRRPPEAPVSEAVAAEVPCQHCGLPLLAGKKFCRHCGKPQAPAPAIAGQPTVGPQPAPGAPTPSWPQAGLQQPPQAPPPQPIPQAPPQAQAQVAPAPPTPSSPAVPPAPQPAAPPVQAPIPVPFAPQGTPVTPPFEPRIPAVGPIPIPPPGAAEVSSCQICGLALPPNARFCGHCGANVALFRQASATPQERECASCHGKLAPNAKFCAFCGAKTA